MTTTLAIDTARFGRIEFESGDIVTFAGGLLGFPALHRFVLIQHREGSAFRWMQSLEDSKIAFLVVDPGNYLADYAPMMPEATAKTLELTEDTPRLVYTIVTIPRGKPEEMTLNLAGPLVINAETGQAHQIVIEDDAFPIRYRVFAENEKTQAA